MIAELNISNTSIIEHKTSQRTGVA